MKKVMLLILSAVVFLTLTACESTNQQSQLTQSGKSNHKHTFSSATCVFPETCSCGATNGYALGHNWETATCSKPNTCTRCGATKGSKLGHTYSNGKCIDCGAKASIIASGNCGDSVTFQLDSSGLLNITGTGKMENYSFDYEPEWRKYEYRSYVKEVIISEGVTSIGNLAFYFCEDLETIKIPSSVKKIGGNAFYCCKSLRNVTIPYGVRVLDGTFDSCSSLRTVEIPTTVNVITNGAFRSCSALENIIIPEGVTEIDAMSGIFSRCSNLEWIQIPKSLKTVGYLQFEDCYSLTDIYYLGSKGDYAKINISSKDDCNKYFRSATVHYSTPAPS